MQEINLTGTVQDATNVMNDLKRMNSAGNSECAEDPQTSQIHTETKPNVTSKIAQLAFAEQGQSNLGVESNISTLPGQAELANVGGACLRRTT